MPEQPAFLFSREAVATIPEHLRDTIRQEVLHVLHQLKRQDPESVIVAKTYLGYVPDKQSRFAIGVEARYRDGYETAIIKLGRHDLIEADWAGWQECTHDRHVSSRIFVKVFPFSLPDPKRFAVVYQDAHTLYGPEQGDDGENRPRSLESVVTGAVLHDQVSVESIERAIVDIYTDLQQWFYPDARSNAAAAAQFYRSHLWLDAPQDPITKQPGPSPPPEKQVLLLWQSPANRETRRDAIWALCGKERPNSDPAAETPRYLDAVEFLQWALADSSQMWLPDTLVGRSHGDLHARNVLVGVRRREATYPAVFDYGKMSRNNVLVWDFVKLENELKIRLLPQICQDDQTASTWLLERSRLVSNSSIPASGIDRFHRFRIALAFEETLHNLTDAIESEVSTQGCPPPVAVSGIPKLDRLLSILLRIRKEAAIALGFEQRNRHRLWSDEYNFALGVAGVLHIRWDFQEKESEAALVSSGAALARILAIPELFRSNLGPLGAAGPSVYPSYRVPLAFLRRCWEQSNLLPAREYVESRVLKADLDGNLTERDEIWHAVPLIVESTLIEMEAGKGEQVRTLLRDLREQAVQIGDHETLSRIGRQFKDRGDRLLETAAPGTRFYRSPAWLMYQEARKEYELAYQLTRNYYPGINAATLSDLTDDQERARQLAGEVDEICSNQEVADDERPWVFATQGEARMILGDFPGAREQYAAALHFLEPTQAGLANSMYRQLCRWWKIRGDAATPLLDLFEQHETFARSLSRNYLGRSS